MAARRAPRLRLVGKKTERRQCCSETTGASHPELGKSGAEKFDEVLASAVLFYACLGRSTYKSFGIDRVKRTFLMQTVEKHQLGENSFERS